MGAPTCDPRLLEDLASDRLLEALAGADETGECRVAAERPGGLTTEDHALAVGDEHDHHRVGARVMLSLAVGGTRGRARPRANASPRRSSSRSDGRDASSASPPRSRRGRPPPARACRRRLAARASPVRREPARRGVRRRRSAMAGSTRSARGCSSTAQSGPLESMPSSTCSATAGSGPSSSGWVKQPGVLDPETLVTQGDHPGAGVDPLGGDPVGVPPAAVGGAIELGAGEAVRVSHGQARHQAGALARDSAVRSVRAPRPPAAPRSADRTGCRSCPRARVIAASIDIASR